MHSFHGARADSNDTDDSPRPSRVVLRRQHAERGQRAVVINPTIVIDALRAGLTDARLPRAVELRDELQCVTPLRAAELRVMLEEPLTIPLGSMQRVHPVLRMHNLTVAIEDLTPTEPRIVLRRASASAEDTRRVDRRGAGADEITPATGEGEASTRPGRARAVHLAAPALPAVKQPVNPAWASAETAKAQRDARLKLRALWSPAVLSRNAQRAGSAHAADGCKAHGTPRHARSKQTSSSTRSVHAPRRAAPEKVLTIGNIHPHALCASVVALAAFSFVFAFAATTAWLAHSEVPGAASAQLLQAAQ